MGSREGKRGRWGGVVGDELREEVRARSESPVALREDHPGFCSDKRSLRKFWQSAVCFQTSVRTRPLRLPALAGAGEVCDLRPTAQGGSWGPRAQRLVIHI